MKEKIWFLSPPVFVPTGGINNFYILCSVAEDLGIEAKVISSSPYSHPYPQDLIKYHQKSDNILFRHDMFDIPNIQEGDIVVQPEIYDWKPIFSKPVRRVTYIQNWSIVTPVTWENHYWVYNNMSFLTYCIEAIAKTNYPDRYRLPSDGVVQLDNTDHFIKSKKLKWSTVSPYFIKEEFSISEKEIDIVMFPRKSPMVVDIFKQKFGDKVLVVDGVAPEEVKEILSRTKIVVLPSAAEGLCFPAIEAMLSGAVVVTWNCGAPEDYVINNFTGMLSKYGDIENLISNTQYLLDNPDKLEDISKKAYELITNLYTRENTKKELLLTYYASLSIDPE